MAHHPFASCLLPLASCLLPFAFCLLPFAFCLLPLCQQPADELGGGELIRPGKEEWGRNWMSVVVVAAAWGMVAPET